MRLQIIEENIGNLGHQTTLKHFILNSEAPRHYNTLASLTNNFLLHGIIHFILSFYLFCVLCFQQETYQKFQTKQFLTSKTDESYIATFSKGKNWGKHWGFIKLEQTLLRCTLFWSLSRLCILEIDWPVPEQLMNSSDIHQSLPSSSK